MNHTHFPSLFLVEKAGAYVGSKILLLCCVIMSAVSCNYDDSGIKESVSQLSERLSALESKVSQLNADILSLQTVLAALEKNVYVSDVSTSDDGCVIQFSDGKSVTIRNGKDGLDAPVVGIAVFEDRYYWTMTVGGTTSWLTDADGNKLPVTDQAAGVTPQLKVSEAGDWLVSYDNGATFQAVLDADGNKVSALGTPGAQGDKGDKGDTGAQGDKGDKGDKGDTGATGASGSPLFSSVTYTAESVTFVLAADGTVLVIPRLQSLGISYDRSIRAIPITPLEGVQVGYTILGADDATFIEVLTKGNLAATLTALTASTGTLDIRMTGTSLEPDSKVVVLLCNAEKTVTTVLTFRMDTSTAEGTDAFVPTAGTWDE